MDKDKLRYLKYYYKNREERIKKQRIYDKKNKEKKNEYERKKRRGEAYNRKKRIQHYSQKKHKPILMEKYGECQIKFQGCLKNKNLQIHHLKYTTDIKDCILVCSNCHKIMHRKS